MSEFVHGWRDRQRAQEHGLSFPTAEDLLDVNFWSIVSDCRGLIAGTLQPRPWADLASTWQESSEFHLKQKRIYQREYKKRKNGTPCLFCRRKTRALFCSDRCRRAHLRGL